MRVTIQRTGGFTGIPMTKSIDSAAMSLDEANQLRQMVDAADFFELPSVIPFTSQPDRFQFQIIVDQDGKKHSVSCSETAIPPRLKPLLTWLMESARQAGKPAR